MWKLRKHLKMHHWETLLKKEAGIKNTFSTTGWDLFRLGRNWRPDLNKTRPCPRVERFLSWKTGTWSSDSFGPMTVRWASGGRERLSWVDLLELETVRCVLKKGCLGDRKASGQRDFKRCAGAGSLINDDEKIDELAHDDGGDDDDDDDDDDQDHHSTAHLLKDLKGLIEHLELLRSQKFSLTQLCH